VALRGADWQSGVVGQQLATCPTSDGISLGGEVAFARSNFRAGGFLLRFVAQFYADVARFAVRGCRRAIPEAIARLNASHEIGNVLGAMSYVSAGGLGDMLWIVYSRILDRPHGEIVNIDRHGDRMERNVHRPQLLDQGFIGHPHSRLVESNHQDGALPFRRPGPARLGIRLEQAHRPLNADGPDRIADSMRVHAAQGRGNRLLIRREILFQMRIGGRDESRRGHRGASA
jgi:hypothetical protein